MRPCRTTRALTRARVRDYVDVRNMLAAFPALDFSVAAQCASACADAQQGGFTSETCEAMHVWRCAGSSSITHCSAS